jgi:hypothetical protein
MRGFQTLSVDWLQLRAAHTQSFVTARYRGTLELRYRHFFNRMKLPLCFSFSRMMTNE